jgi:hypothetical protein
MQIDKFSLDSLHDGAELHLQSLEPWIQVIRNYLCNMLLGLRSVVVKLVVREW